MSQQPLTRRRFLASLSAGALIALAACQRPGPTPTPAPTPAATPVPPLPIAQGFASFLGTAVQGYRVEFEAGDASETDIAVTPVAAADTGREQSRITRVYAPVTHWRLPLRNIERAELTNILNGKMTDWE